MKCLKVFLIIMCLLCAVCYGLLVFLFGYPVVLSTTSSVQQQALNYNKGERLNPLSGFDFNSDEWVAYLLVSNEDYNTVKRDLIGSKLVTKNIAVLNFLKKECEFIYTDGDIATVTSSFVLYKNGIKVFETGVVVEGSIHGFQSQHYGWITTKHNLISTFNRFDKIKYPLVVLK